MAIKESKDFYRLRKAAYDKIKAESVRATVEEDEPPELEIPGNLIGLAYQASVVGLAYDPYNDHSAELINRLPDGNMVVNVGIKQPDKSHKNVRIILPPYMTFPVYVESSPGE